MLKNQKMNRSKKGIVMKGINLIFASITIAALLTISFVFSSFYGSEDNSFIYEQQMSAKENSKIIMILAENNSYFAQKLVKRETEEFLKRLKQIYGEAVQCRLKIDSLEENIGCKKIMKAVEEAEFMIPGYDGNVHTISIEVAK